MLCWKHPNCLDLGLFLFRFIPVQLSSHLSEQQQRNRVMMYVFYEMDKLTHAWDLSDFRQFLTVCFQFCNLHFCEQKKENQNQFAPKIGFPTLNGRVAGSGK